MSIKIERDQNRFRQIVRGKIRQNLRKYVSHGEMIGRKGRDLVSIPIPQLDVPRLPLRPQRLRRRRPGGRRSRPAHRPRQAAATATARPAASRAPHILEVEVSLEELAEILGDELELPRIEPKGKAEHHRGEVPLLQHPPHRPGVAAALQADLHAGHAAADLARTRYDPDKPRVVPIRDDKRYRSWSTIYLPVANAVCIYMMDVSGSMTDEQKEIVRIEAFWLDTWLKSQYDGVEVRYIIHDAAARDVDEETFYHTRESGGTRISSAYKVCVDLIKREVSARRSGTSTASSSPTATTGAKTTSKACNCCARRSCPR